MQMMDGCLLLTGIVIVILITYSIFLHCMKKAHRRWFHQGIDMKSLEILVTRTENLNESRLV
jgi:hypothetical protein